VSSCFIINDEYRANIVGIYIKNVNDDPSGQIESAYTIIEGRWRSVEWNQMPTPVYGRWNDRRFLLDRHRRIDRLPEEELTAPCQIFCSLDGAVTVNDFMVDMNQRCVIYMQIGRSGKGDPRWGAVHARHALVLEPTGRVDNEYRCIRHRTNTGG
jgi:hypothetical protein